MFTKRLLALAVALTVGASARSAEYEWQVELNPDGKASLRVFRKRSANPGWHAARTDGAGGVVKTTSGSEPRTSDRAATRRGARADGWAGA
jgi:hypothetical protein